MNKQQFKAISHEYRELNFKAHSSSHICTARNCSCRDSYQDRHIGWEWRIAQQHGEGMATRIARMFAWRKRPLPQLVRPTVRSALDDCRMRLVRKNVLRNAMARCDELFANPTAKTR